MKFRKKPVVIEAFLTSNLLLDAAGRWWGLPKCVVEQYDAGNIIFLPDAILISTLEGQMRAEPNDMVICGIKGELYPCKPDIFKATYEAVP
jgi:hypothetical protein